MRKAQKKPALRKQAQGVSRTQCSAYLYSDRKTWFCGHTIVRYHCSLFHHYHLHNLFPHHSATHQGCNFHQDDTEIHLHYNQQENESLRYWNEGERWVGRGERDKREIMISLDNIFFNIFSFFRHYNDARENIYFTLVV